MGTSQRLLAVFAATILLSGCDAWPTSVWNHTASSITFVYHHKQYKQWSYPLDISGGHATKLARGHYLEDVIGIKIIDQGKVYLLSDKSVTALQNRCWRGIMQKITNLGDCYLTYLGDGRLEASISEPSGLPDHGWSNGG
jgi:hypothetical protein